MTQPTAANDNTPRTARSLSDLGALLAYRNRPEHFEPVQSNWTTDPQEAKVEPEVRMDLHTEQRLEITPSLEEIYREMHHEPTRNEDRQIIAIGSLKFSDGTQIEVVDMIGPDGEVIQGERVMPTGAMLGCTERLTVAAGGGKSPASVDISNTALSERMGVSNVKYVPGSRNKRRGKSYTPDESRVLIDKAIANTPKLPPVTKCPPGLPAGTRQASDCFIGMKIGSTGKGGGIQWQDAHDKLRDREEWMRVERELQPEHKGTLDAAMRARNLADIGNYGHRRTRERQGMARLQAANDNLTAAMRKKLA